MGIVTNALWKIYENVQERNMKEIVGGMGG